MAQNLFNEENPQEIFSGDNVINNRTQKILRTIDQNGIQQDIVAEIHDSRPDGNDGFIDSTMINLAADHAGNPLPEDPRSITISHSGLYISADDQRRHCTSFLHFSPNRNILLNQDGWTTPNGAICTRCYFWQNTLFIIFGLFGIGLVVGLFKGTGFF